MYILYNRTPMIYSFLPIVPQCSIAFELYMIKLDALSTLTASIIYLISLMYKKVVFFSVQFILVLPPEIQFIQESYDHALLSMILGLKSVIDGAHSFVFNWFYQETIVRHSIHPPLTCQAIKVYYYISIGILMIQCHRSNSIRQLFNVILKRTITRMKQYLMK
jgi:hypothetical protein